VDAVALGEADETWPNIVNDAANGQLKEIYTPKIDAKGQRHQAGITRVSSYSVGNA
jgi:hypothetical protein